MKTKNSLFSRNLLCKIMLTLALVVGWNDAWGSIVDNGDGTVTENFVGVTRSYSGGWILTLPTGWNYNGSTSTLYATANTNLYVVTASNTSNYYITPELNGAFSFLMKSYGTNNASSVKAYMCTLENDVFTLGDLIGEVNIAKANPAADYSEKNISFSGHSRVALLVNYAYIDDFTYTPYEEEEITTPILSITHPGTGDGFGYVTVNTTKTYTVENTGIGSMDVNITSSDAAFTVSASTLTGITNDGTGKTFDVTFIYNSEQPQPHSADITITPTFEGAIPEVITVIAGPEVELNEDKATTWTTGSGKNVYVKYTAKNGWNTICFPISVSSYKTQLFGSSATVKAYAFSAYDSSTGTISFETANYPGTGTPYLVHVDNAASAPFVVSSIWVNYSPTGAGKTEKGTSPQITFQGTFSPKAAGTLTGNYGITSNGQLRKAGSGATMKGYRAYFTGLGAAGARIITIDDDGTTTDLGFVQMVDPEAKDVYNLHGQRVEKGRKGIYVVNGKKVVIK